MKLPEMKYELKIPSGVTVDIHDGMFTVKGAKGEVKRAFVFPKIKITKENDAIVFFAKKPTKREKSDKPIIMTQNSTVSDVAEKILKGFSSKIKQTKIWGPSSKFPGQIVGLKHKLKDLDVVEFKTK